MKDRNDLITRLDDLNGRVPEAPLLRSRILDRIRDIDHSQVQSPLLKRWIMRIPMMRFGELTAVILFLAVIGWLAFQTAQTRSELAEVVQHFAGPDVKLGDSNIPLSWWKSTKNPAMYRVLYADLKIRDVKAEDLPKVEAAAKADPDVKIMRLPAGVPRPAPTYTKAWYFDTVTGEHFVDMATRIAPFKRENGHEAVRAHFFSCGDCAEEKRFLGYYEKYTPEVAAKLEEPKEANEVNIVGFQGRLYSKDGKTWLAAEKPDGVALIGDLQKKCPPKMLQYCTPN